MEISRYNDQKRCEYKQWKTVQKTFFNFHSQKQITSFSYHPSVWFTHGLQHHCFLGQANLYRLCGLWQMSRQIWTIFLDQKRLQLLGYSTKVFKRADKNAEFWLRQNLSMGEAAFNQFI